MIVDIDGCEWAPNRDGTFRCLNAEIESMTVDEIKAEFGILMGPAGTFAR